MKIRREGTELFHVDRRTDMTKLIFRLSQFCQRANKKIEIEQADK